MSAHRRRWPWAAAVVGMAAIVFVVVWFEPQKLFIDERVDDALPTVSGRAEELAAGEFVSLDHGTSGVVRVIELADGRRIVRLEGLDTDNGPDLYLYLSTNVAAGDEGAFDDDFVDLGSLKGNLGDQNYDVPAGTDLGRYRSVVVWCDRFDSAFGAADLVPPEPQ